eukprot:1953732-Amphidinium_carterae.1
MAVNCLQMSVNCLQVFAFRLGFHGWVEAKVKVRRLHLKTKTFMVQPRSGNGEAQGTMSRGACI